MQNQTMKAECQSPQENSSDFKVVEIMALALRLDLLLIKQVCRPFALGRNKCIL